MAYRHILVPFDGSPLADAALSLAGWLAWRGGGEVDVVRAVPDHPPLSIEPLAGMADPAASVARAKTELSARAARLRESGVMATGSAFAGEPVAVLLEYVERFSVDLAVMGTHARPLAERWLLGSVASEMARRSPIPVLLVPRDAMPVRDDALRVLIALDGSAVAETALEAAVELAATVPAELTLFQVLPGEGPTNDQKTPAWYEEQVLGVDAYLEQVQQRLARRDLHARLTYSAGTAAEEIVLFAERGAFDVVAIGTRGLSGLPRLMWGSVADHVVRHAHLPVLVTSAAAVSRGEAPPAARLEPPRPALT